MKYYSVTKTDENGNASEEIVSADSMSVDMGCLLFYGSNPTSSDSKFPVEEACPLIRTYGIGGWMNAVIK